MRYVHLFRDSEIHRVPYRPFTIIGVSLKYRDLHSACHPWLQQPTRFAIIQCIHCCYIIGYPEIWISVEPLPKDKYPGSIYRFVVLVPKLHLASQPYVISWISKLVKVRHRCSVWYYRDVGIQRLSVTIPQGECMPLIQEYGWSKRIRDFYGVIILGFIKDSYGILEYIAIKQFCGLCIEVIACVDFLDAIFNAIL